MADAFIGPDPFVMPEKLVEKLAGPKPLGTPLHPRVPKGPDEELRKLISKPMPEELVEKLGGPLKPTKEVGAPRYPELEVEGTPTSDTNHLEALTSASAEYTEYLEAVLPITPDTSAEGTEVPVRDKISSKIGDFMSLVTTKVGSDPTTAIRPDDVVIGTVKLGIPPTDIQISESRGSTSVAGLRTNTEALLKTGRGAIEITMNMRFPDTEAINNQLRPLIAQFRTAPFITIVSEYLANAVQKRFVEGVQSDKLKALQNRYDVLTKQLTDLWPRINQIIALGLGIQPWSAELLRVMGNLNSSMEPENIEKEAGKLKGIMDRVMQEAEKSFGLSKTDRLKKLGELADLLSILPGIAAEIKQVRHSMAGIENLRKKDRAPIIPIAQFQLEFGPDASDRGETLPNAARATLKAYLFNYQPFSMGFEFKDRKGDFVYDMRQCPSYGAYLTRRFLKPGFGLGLKQPSFTVQGDRPLGSFQEDYEGLLGFRFPTKILERVPTDDRTDRYINPIREVITTKNASLFPSKFTVPLVELGTGNFVNMHEDLVFDRLDPSFIMSNIAIRLENKLAAQPIQGSLYPAYQYMGGVNARVSMMCSVVGSGTDAQHDHDQVLRKLQYMKSESEAVALTGSRMRRHHKIFIANNWANLAGIQAVQLLNKGISTSPAGPAQSQVRLEFVEFRASQESREMLLNGQPGHAEEVRLALRFATKYYYEKFLERKERLENQYMSDLLVTQQREQGQPFNMEAYQASVNRSKTSELWDVVGWHLYGDDVPTDIEVLPKDRGKLEWLYKEGEVLRKESKVELYVSWMGRLVEWENIWGNKFYDTCYEWVLDAKTIADSEPYGKTVRAITAAGKLVRPHIDTMMDRKFPQGFKFLSKEEESTGAKPARGEGRVTVSVQVYTYVGYKYYWKDLHARDSTDVPGIINKDTATAAFLRAPDYGRATLDIGIDDPISTSSPGAVGTMVKDTERFAVAQLQEWKGRRREGMVSPFMLEIERVPGRFIDYLVDLTMSQGAFDPVLAPDKREADTYVPYRIAPERNLRDRILKLSRWMIEHIPEYKVLMMQLINQARDRSTYPDLALPTFEEAFQPVFEALETTYGTRNDLNDYPKEVKQFLRKFVPTYQDLGKRPGLEETRHHFARSRKDLVDPDFYWYYQRTQDQLEYILQDFKGEFSDPGTTNWDSDPAGAISKVVNDAGKSEEEIARDRKPADVSQAGILFDLAHRKGGEPFTKDYVAVDKRVRDTIKAFDPLSAKYNIALARRSMDSYQDDRWRMSKCYPTFQLYFLEKDAEEWGMLDDVFGYMSVSEMHIRRGKFMPAVADITLINVSGNLDESMASSIATKRYKYEGGDWVDQIIGPAAGIVSGDLGEAFSDSPKMTKDMLSKSKTTPKGDTEPYTDEDKLLDHFFLGPGTMIAVKMGYSSKQDELETVFTGQIVEIERGDMIHIVAQDYSIELTVPIDKDLAKGSIWNWVPLADKLLGTGAGDAPSVIKSVLDSSPADHYGKFDWMAVFSIYAGKSHDRFGGLSDVWGRRRSPADESTKGDTYKSWLSDLAGLYEKMTDYLGGRNRKMENIFYTEQPWLYQLLAGPRWVIPHKSGLEVLHELTRHNPGWVAATRPYDLNGATLYFGKTSGFYYHTAWGKIEHEKWMNTTAKGDKLKDAAWVIGSILKGYESSEYYRHYEAFVLAKSPVSVTASPYSPLQDTAMTKAIDFYGLPDYLKGYLGKDDSSASALPSLSAVREKLSDTGLRAIIRSFFNKDFTGAGVVLTDVITWLYRQKGDFDLPGSIFVSPDNWKSLVEQLSAVHGGGDKETRDLRYNLFKANPNANLWSFVPFARKNAERASTVSGKPVTSDSFNGAVKHIVSRQQEWKAFIATLSCYLSDTLFDNAKNLVRLAQLNLELEPYMFPPRTKPFRAYHHADATSTIVNNGISASRDQMANYVVVHYPESVETTKTKSKAASRLVGGVGREVIQFAADTAFERFPLPYCELTKDERIVRTVTEMNADSMPKAELCAYSNLAEAMRPMYRGELILRGNERVSPWDIVSIHDAYTDMHGHIEVESVTHHFSYEMGFVSSVTPHAVVIPNSHSDWQHCVLHGLMNGLLGFAGQVGSIIFGATLLGKGAAGTAAGVGMIFGGWKGIPAIVKASTGATIWGNIVGQGRYGMRKYPVHFLPLVVSGLPYLVGLQKLGPRGFAVRWGKKWRRFTRGIVGASYNIADQIRTGIPLD